MPDTPDLDQTIADAAQAPKRARGDQGEVENQSLQDLIEADRYLASKKAMRSRTKGLRLTKIVPPGAA